MGGLQSSSSKHGYMEEEDVNGYDVNWFNSNYVIGNAYISVFNTGITGANSTKLFDMYTTTSNYGSVLEGQAYFPSTEVNTEAGAETEVAYTGGNVTCASSPPYTMKGANDAGGYSAGTEIQGSQDGSSWHPLETSQWSMFNFAPYYNKALNGVSSFESYGG